MRTCDAIDLLIATAKACRLDSASLSVQEFQDLRTLLSDRLAMAWEHHYWPDLCPTEKRYFRPLWNSGTAYPAPTQTVAQEVYYPGPQTYYQTLQGSTNQPPATLSGGTWNTNLAYWAQCGRSYTAANWDATITYVQGNQVYDPVSDRCYQLFVASALNQPVTDTSKWGVLTPFDQYVAYAQTGQTAFDHAFSAWDRDPKNFQNAARQPFQLSPNGCQVAPTVPFVWLKFRKQCPVLTGDLFNAAAVYTSGQQMYYATSGVGTRPNWFTANQTTVAGDTPDSAPSKWTIVQIPLLFRRYLIHGAAADYQRAEEDQEAADREFALAEAALDQCVSLVFGQQGQQTEVEFCVR
jgi:hypothetical protein